jgi:hypothetical protein
MARNEYQIEYSIQRRPAGTDSDFEEIGFGSSGAWDNLDAAMYAASSDVDNRSWETTGGMPDPASIPSRSDLSPD